MYEFVNGLSISFADFWDNYFGVVGFETSLVKFVAYYICIITLLSFFLFLFRKLFMWGD